MLSFEILEKLPPNARLKVIYDELVWLRKQIEPKFTDEEKEKLNEAIELAKSKKNKNEWK